MKMYCEVFTRYVLPSFRLLISKKLVKEYGFSQVKTAGILGISQAAVNYYLRLKRGTRLTGILENDEKIQSFVDEATRLISENRMMEIEKVICDMCKYVKSNSELLEKILTAVGLTRADIYMA